MVLLLVFSAAWGQSTVLRNSITWVAPSQYTDGSSLPPAELASYELLCATVSAPSTYPLSMVVPGDQTVVTKEQAVQGLGLEFGVTYYCAVTATATNTMTSARSNEVNFTVEDLRQPQAPVLRLE